MSTQRILLSVVLVLALLAPSVAESLGQSVAAPSAASSSMLIVENAGQWPSSARFQVWNSPLGPGTTWLAEDAIWLVVGGERVMGGIGDWERGRPRVDEPHSPSPPLAPSVQTALKLTFPGSNPDVRIEPFDPLTTTVSYFVGSDPAQWFADVPVYAGVRYVDLYPGIDLILNDAQGRAMDWRLETRPGARDDVIRMRVEGAQSLTLDGRQLDITTPNGALSLPLPESYAPWSVDGLARDGDLATDDRELAMAYSTAFAPLDDPTDLLYGTFLGSGQNTDQAFGSFVDQDGRVYLTGQTWSSSFPTTPGVFDPSFNGGYDAFVARLSTDGRTLSYSTFLGGSGYDQGNSIEVDSAGLATVAGETWSSNFPVSIGAFDPTNNGERDGFVVRLSSAGTALHYSTYLGGSQSDMVWEVSLDSTGCAIVAGETFSTDFPTTVEAFDPTYNGGWDGFVARLSTTGTVLEWSTFLGGNGYDNALSVVVDTMGRPTVTGGTASPDFPIIPGAYDPSYNGYDDAYIVRFTADGSAIEYASFLGGNSYDRGAAIALAPANGVCLTGLTYSTDFPTTPLAYDLTPNGYTDAFVTCIGTDDSTLRISTYLGGGNYDEGTEIWVDDRGQPYVLGSTSSASFPITTDAFDTTHNGGGDDAFLVRLSSNGRVLSYGTFLGGSGQDRGTALALDTAYRAYVAGYTDSTDLPTTPSSFDPSYNGAGDAYAMRLAVGNLADLNGDGIVTVADVIAIAEVWGQSGVFDLNGDGLVTIADIMIVAALWSQQAGPPHDLDDDGVITVVDITRTARWWDWPVP